MNLKVLIVGLISAVVLGTFLYSKSRNSNTIVEGAQTQAQGTDQTQKNSLSSQIKSMGAVEVEITPTKLKSGQDMVFELSLNTHSVDLDYNYTQILTVEDNEGNTYKATNWSGGNSGHHLSGQIEFEPLSKDTQSIKLNVSRIDDQKEVFEWDL